MTYCSCANLKTLFGAHPIFYNNYQIKLTTPIKLCAVIFCEESSPHYKMRFYVLKLSPTNKRLPSIPIWSTYWQSWIAIINARVFISPFQEYDPSQEDSDNEDTCSNDRDQPQAPQGNKYGIPFNYQEKYRKLLGDLDCAEKSAIKMEPNKAFGYG